MTKSAVSRKLLSCHHHFLNLKELEVTIQKALCCMMRGKEVACHMMLLCVNITDDAIYGTVRKVKKNFDYSGSIFLYLV